MGRRGLWSVAVCGALVLAATGCSSDDDSTPGVFSEQAVETVLADSVIPAVELVTLILEAPVKSLRAQTAARSAAALGGTGDACEPLLDVCDSGTAEICFTSADEVTIDLDQCAIKGDDGTEVVDGRIVGTATESGGLLSLDLTVGDRRLDGEVAFAFKADCAEETFDRLAIRTPDMTTRLSGTIAQCPKDDWPAGTLFVAAQTDDFGDLRLEVLVDGSPLADLDVFDLGSDDLLGTCAFDLGTEQATCQASD